MIEKIFSEKKRLNIYYKVVCGSMSVHISISFTCIGLTFWHDQGPMGMVVSLKQNKNSPVVGNITEESVWMFDIDYVIQNNSNLYSC